MASVLVLLGIGFFAVFVALVVDAVRDKMDELRKGLGSIVESGHTVILGWGPEAIVIVRELANANESEGGGRIAVLCSASKQAAEAELYSIVPPTQLRGTRVVFRTGSRLCASDLAKMSLSTAKSIIVLSNSSMAPADSDSETLQVVLNIGNLQLEGVAVMAQVRVSDNMLLMDLVSKRSVVAVASHEVCSSLLIQFSRGPGLAAVYQSILGFDDSEFYVKHWPELVGCRWADIAPRMPDAIPVGYISAQGECILNPDPAFVLEADDELVVLAEDDDTYQPEARSGQSSAALVPAALAQMLVAPSKAKAKPERILLAGWRRDLASLVHNLDSQVAPGSEVHILSTHTLPEREVILLHESGGSFATLQNLTVVHHIGSTVSRAALESLPLASYTSVIVPSIAANETDVLRSDAQVLTTVLLIRAIQAMLPRDNPRPSPPRVSATRRASSSTNVSAMVDGVTPAASPGESAAMPPLRVVTRRESLGQALTGEDESPPSRGGSGRLMMRRSTATFGFEGNVLELAKEVPIVAEVLDPRTQLTVSDAFNSNMPMVCEFLQSSEHVSKIMAMTSEDAAVKVILDQLLGGSASHLAVLPAAQLVHSSACISFEQLAMHALRAHRAILCGYLNPAKAKDGKLIVPSECIINPPNKRLQMSWGGRGLVVIRTGNIARPPIAGHNGLAHGNNSVLAGQVKSLATLSSIRALRSGKPPSPLQEDLMQQVAGALNQPLRHDP